MAACFSQFSIMFLIVVGDKNLRYPGIIPQQEEEVAYHLHNLLQKNRISTKHDAVSASSRKIWTRS
jgi:hypothetical protein